MKSESEIMDTIRGMIYDEGPQVTKAEQLEMFGSVSNSLDIEAAAYEEAPDKMGVIAELEEKKKDRIVALRELLKVQLTYGNWNSGPYMHGMANGMILAIATIDDTKPKFIDAPDEWLSDLKA